MSGSPCHGAGMSGGFHHDYQLKARQLIQHLQVSACLFERRSCSFSSRSLSTSNLISPCNQTVIRALAAVDGQANRGAGASAQRLLTGTHNDTHTHTHTPQSTHSGGNDLDREICLESVAQLRLLHSVTLRLPRTPGPRHDRLAPPFWKIHSIVSICT